MHISEALLERGYDLVVVEPNIQENNKFTLINLDDALNTVDIVVLLVKHRQFVEKARIGGFHRGGVFDFCGILG